MLFDHIPSNLFNSGLLVTPYVLDCVLERRNSYFPLHLILRLKKLLPLYTNCWLSYWKCYGSLQTGKSTGLFN